MPDQKVKVPRKVSSLSLMSIPEVLQVTQELRTKWPLLSLFLCFCFSTKKLMLAASHPTWIQLGTDP